MTALAGSALRRYHEVTKHSPLSVAASRHRLDWSNKPLPSQVRATDLTIH